MAHGIDADRLGRAGPGAEPRPRRERENWLGAPTPAVRPRWLGAATADTTRPGRAAPPGIRPNDGGHELCSAAARHTETEESTPGRAHPRAYLRGRSGDRLPPLHPGRTVAWHRAVDVLAGCELNCERPVPPIKMGVLPRIVFLELITTTLWRSGDALVKRIVTISAATPIAFLVYLSRSPGLAAMFTTCAAAADAGAAMLRSGCRRRQRPAAPRRQARGSSWRVALRSHD
jgi:hypothetical protein